MVGERKWSEASTALSGVGGEEEGEGIRCPRALAGLSMAAGRQAYWAFPPRVSERPPGSSGSRCRRVDSAEAVEVVGSHHSLSGVHPGGIPIGCR